MADIRILLLSNLTVEHLPICGGGGFAAKRDLEFTRNDDDGLSLPLSLSRFEDWKRARVRHRGGGRCVMRQNASVDLGYPESH